MAATFKIIALRVLINPFPPPELRCYSNRARSLELFAILPKNGSRDSLSCFHSSASASQYSISEYSISFLASAACSRHIASNAANCSFEYMGFPVVAQSNPFVIKAN